jgi:hypothetical protein
VGVQVDEAGREPARRRRPIRSRAAPPDAPDLGDEAAVDTATSAGARRRARAVDDRGASQ